MEKTVMLTVTGVHDHGDDQETVETVTQAQYFLKNGAHYFLYDEKEEDFAEKTKTRIKYRDGRLEIVRQGSVKTELIFEEQKDCFTDYPTPAGSMRLLLSTRELRFGEQKDELRILVRYMMQLEGTYETECTIEIIAKPMA